jgi:predicted AlkP superfamily pyrophosphatase or phosphodiesterase
MTRVLGQGWLVAVLFGVSACSAAPVPVSRTAEAASTPNAVEQRPVQHVIVVTVDGLMPDSYLNPDRYGLKIPTLRKLVKEGASSQGALSVFPTLTYPAHTSIASGMLPAHHGIVTNSAFDPLEVNQNAWRWYDVDVKVPRLWDVAREAGYRTAVLDWPVTVGETATYHVPEFWRAKVPEDTKLIAALSTPGLLDEVSARFPEFRAGFRPQDVSDEAGMDLAIHVLERHQPHVLFLHIWQVDAAQHHFGLESGEAKQAIETADEQIARLLQTLSKTGLLSKSVLVVASDHGFAPVTRCVNPSYLLQRARLLEVDGAGRVTDWQAAAIPAHGVAYVYVRDAANAELRARTLKVFQDQIQAGNSGIARILDHTQILALGGDPEAFIALEAEAGTYFGTGREQYDSAPSYRATHGYSPEQPQMRASLILYGATVTHGQIIDARLIDIAPTLAGMLGLSLGATDGRPLRIEPAAGWPLALPE